ncbi:hypothetical protein CLV59_103171 [Chitinophaga dinghuensis]|uniref:Uncharacterized protein n=1 Tax=Chitinophaga dinghuensis TaxID=1539050 RepID=A0A327W1L5_9BACT|nr:hypothetical protein CLV59_103171 [Chitinophaga dinghuensis]
MLSFCFPSGCVVPFWDCKDSNKVFILANLF